jgi:YidC/Oxa1 family membrane protein insertase
VGIYHVVVGAHIPYALGFSIIFLTIIIRLVLYPLTASQLRATQKMQKVTPHINKLKEKHKNDAKMLQQETMRLYKEHGINPAAGCLPMLIQFPIIIALYTVLQQVVRANSGMLVTQINKIVYFPFLKITKPWDENFFGLHLGKSPENLMNTFGFLILLVPLITIIFQLIQSKMMFPVVSKKENDGKKEDDFASAMQTQSLYVLPLIIGFTSFKFPMGLSLYWNTFTIFGIIQQYRIQGWGGLIEWLKFFKKKEIV